MRKRLLIFNVLLVFAIGLCAQGTQRLDYSFGFREFKLKEPRSSFASYQMKKTNFYQLPDIIDEYTLPYDMQIGNTKINELHLFFLGDNLVRVSAILKDSLSLSYLKKSFGDGEAPSVTVKIDQKSKEEIATGKLKFAYSPIWCWKAETVRFEEKWLYLCDDGSCVKRMCLDLYLVDFQDLMRSILNTTN